MARLKAFLHSGDRRAATSKTVRETEAEGVALVVSHAIGLDTGTAASDYIQLYAGNKETLPSDAPELMRFDALIICADHSPVLNPRACSRSCLGGAVDIGSLSRG